MSFKKRGERSELGPKQKHNALVPIKSVHSNFLLEKDKTKRVKVCKMVLGGYRVIPAIREIV